MVSIDRKSTVYTIGRIYVDAITKASFRHLKMEGKDQLPEDGLIILAPNHCNTLMDALVILQSDRGPSAYGARADIFRKPKVANILRWLRIVPLARVRDGLEMVKGNAATFEEIVACLANKVPFCIFGEGTHHPGYKVFPMRSGVFRIAELTREKTGEKVWIVPIGLSYSDFYNFRNDLTIRFGQAIDADTIIPMSPKDRSDLLTAKVQELVIDPQTRSWYHDTENSKDKSTKLARGIIKVLSLPLFALFALLSLPEWLTAELLIGKMKDKAWSNTTRYACILIMLPLLVIIGAVLGFIFMKWYHALLLILLIAVAPFCFYDLLRFYRNQ